jgi:hypothetical protein
MKTNQVSTKPHMGVIHDRGGKMTNHTPRHVHDIATMRLKRLHKEATSQKYPKRNTHSRLGKRGSRADTLL